MRTGLKPFQNVRYTYVATFNRYGKNTVSGRTYKTMLFTNVKNIFGDFVCDHIWIREAKKFNKFKLKKGDIVSFSAVVKPYKRGYYDTTDPSAKDYRLVYIKNIKKRTCK